jgi:hypothetical protein
MFGVRNTQGCQWVRSRRRFCLDFCSPSSWWQQASAVLRLLNRCKIESETHPEAVHSVRDAKDWKNPYLIVRPDGIEILGMTPVGRAIAVELVPGVLERLPDIAWPYGLIVAVQDVGILSGKKDLARIKANRTKLLRALQGFGVAVDRWPSG